MKGLKELKRENDLHATVFFDHFEDKSFEYNIDVDNPENGNIRYV